ncbi:histidine kinase [Microbacterium sp. Kw_RZR3]|uniref:sensor histidine kinase n=1 Tax=Microbacterium sp. Kw_RZR3 TaxID=3032903 RepID=UPI0023DCD791|nr:histidine kinase [Microbacterium sp. Kw_RZR3]MDF2046904.1 histidine kinase [Microbacterium sp. Kw_RZR3]
MTPHPTAFGAALTVFGAALCTWGLFSAPRPMWALVLALLALAAWLVRTALVFVQRSAAARTARVAALCAIGAGALAGTSTGANSLIPAAVCAMVLVADQAVSVVAAAVTACGGVALVAAGAVLWPTSVSALAGMVAAVLVGALAGFSRRQGAQARRREALLAERERALREEAGRNALARDLHDVLAHTLGGLVVQLDAAEALLEAGDASSAHRRVASARELAASGLGEARRAVAALRRPRQPGVEAEAADRDPVASIVLDRRLDELVDMHRALGGEIAWERSGDPAPLDRAQADALHRALQEALSNVRRHAPGCAVTARLAWRPGVVRLRIENPLPSSPPPTPSAAPGFGLRGMRERVDALALGGTVTAGPEAGSFVLTVEEVLA